MSNFEYVLSFAGIIFVVIVPLLTMRVIAEERRQKTDQLLYALPISTTDVVLGKYAALLVVFLVPLAVIAVYPLIFSCFGEVYLPVSYGSIFAYFVMGAALIAVGVPFFAHRKPGHGGGTWRGGDIVQLLQREPVRICVADSCRHAHCALCIDPGAGISRALADEKRAPWLCCLAGVDGALLHRLRRDATAFEGLLPKIMKTLSLLSG